MQIASVLDVFDFSKTVEKIDLVFADLIEKIINLNFNQVAWGDLELVL